MNRLRKRRHSVEHDNIHRWLISYADYMTLMFALFVVLYAMAMVNEKPFESITESFGRVFEVDTEERKNASNGNNILTVNSKTVKSLYGNSVIEASGTELLDNENNLSSVSPVQAGSNLLLLEKELNVVLYDLVESGFAQLQIDGEWLEIELNSALLFPSGSSTVTKSAETILSVVYDIIGKRSNFIRVRGYTDNQNINNEIFASNWELSVFRATTILRTLQGMGVNPARMAIEGYGQYYPSAENLTPEGRAKNRKVVIAISKYGLEQVKPSSVDSKNLQGVKKTVLTKNSNEEDKEQSKNIQVIRLNSGNIRITTRKDNDEKSMNAIETINRENNEITEQNNR